MKKPDLTMSKPVLLCILDGWGYREDEADNAIARANTPNWDQMTATCLWDYWEPRAWM